MIKYFFVLWLLWLLISCSTQSVNKVSNNLNVAVEVEKDTVDFVTDNNFDTLKIINLVRRIQAENFTYLSDTIFGECLFLSYNSVIDELNYPLFVTKVDLLKEREIYDDFFSGLIKDKLIKKLNEFEFTEVRDNIIVVSISTGSKEFESACMFYFTDDTRDYSLTRVNAVG